MQIPSSAIAATVSTISSPVKSERANAAEAVNTPIQVERSGESSADRDAQGQGDGMGPRDTKKKTADAIGNPPPNNAVLDVPAPTLPDEPPSQLDMVG